MDFKRTFSALLMLMLLFNFCSCSQKDYHFYREDYMYLPGWECTDEEFLGTYLDMVKSKIGELLSVCNIDFEEKYDIDEETPSSVEIYLFNDISTTRIALYSSGSCYLELMFYGNDTITWKDYEAQKPYVNFLNDLTNYLAYDTITDENRFESLYNECIDEMKYDEYIGFHKSDIYHFDDFVGNVGYGVVINQDEGYYYKMGKNSDLVRMANVFNFDGLLKPLSEGQMVADENTKQLF